MICIEKLTTGNFRVDSLDTFLRHQVVTECWRKTNGQWALQPIAFVEDWDLEKLRANAREILEGLGIGLLGYGAFEDGRLAGFITLDPKPLGSRGQYRQLIAFQVSREHRGQGLGRRLFARLCEEAKHLGAEKLYISAHSSRESQAAYRALGCVEAQEIIPAIAREEPFDVQMEYVL